MKQIIVNVSGLSTEEKQRVNEALAKITGVRKMSNINPTARWFYAPDSSGRNSVSWDWSSQYGKSTHTPQVVLEMAGMATNRKVRKDFDPLKEYSVNVSGCTEDEKKKVQQAFFDVGISWEFGQNTYKNLDVIQYTNTTGSGEVTTLLMYGSTTEDCNMNPEEFFSYVYEPEQALEMVGTATNRKVRRDFDPKQPISVDVSKCTDDEKKKVQQAFFDVGIKWAIGGTEFHYLDAKSYSNSTTCGSRHGSLRYGTMPRTDSISHQQFLELVYEPEQVGYIHADLMAQYAEDAKTTDKPWELWQVKGTGDWRGCCTHPMWDRSLEYRRKSKTHTVNGVEVPDLRVEPKDGEDYYAPNPLVTRLYSSSDFTFHTPHIHRHNNGICYEYTEEGKKAAILHAKAWLGIA